MSVHVGVLDDDHRRMVSMINDLFGCIQNGQCKKTITDTVDALVVRAIEHFALEEALFEKTGYPDAATHKKEHAEMTQRILAYQKECKSGNPDALTVEKANFIWTWLVDHDLTFDKKYAPYLNGKGVI